MTKLFEHFPQELKKQVIEYRISVKKSGAAEGKKEGVEAGSYAFERLRKLPLVTKRNVLSAMDHLFNVKGTTNDEIVSAYSKVVAKAKELSICTMGFDKRFEAWQFSSASKGSRGEQ